MEYGFVTRRKTQCAKRKSSAFYPCGIILCRSLCAGDVDDDYAVGMLVLLGGFVTGQKFGFPGGVHAAAVKIFHIFDFYDLLLKQSYGDAEGRKMTVLQLFL